MLRTCDGAVSSEQRIFNTSSPRAWRRIAKLVTLASVARPRPRREMPTVMGRLLVLEYWRASWSCRPSESRAEPWTHDGRRSAVGWRDPWDAADLDPFLGQ